MSSFATAISTITTTTSIQHLSGYDNLAGAYYGGEPISSFSGSLASADLFSFEIRAPASYKFTAAVDPGETSFRLHIGVAWYAENGGSGLAAPMPATLSLSDYVGSPYTSSIEVRAYNDGKAIYAYGWVTWSQWQPVGTLSFSSILVEADLTAYSGTAHPEALFSTSYGAGVGFLSSRPNLNSVALVSAVPEKPIYQIMSIGLVALVLGRKYKAHAQISRSE